MINLLNQIIEEIDGPIKLFAESFSNETIPDKILSNSKFYKCEFKQVDLSGSLFTNVKFSETKFEEILLILGFLLV